MSFNYLIQNMRHRMPWHIARTLFNQLELPVGQGWESTLEKIHEDKALYEGSLDALTDRFKEHVLCGEKSVRFYPANKSALQKIRKAIATLEIGETIQASSYPHLLSKTELATADEASTLIDIDARDSGTALVFTSIRVVEVKEKLNKVDVKSSVYNEYEQIYGIKKIRTQIFEVVWIPQNGNHIDVRIDLPLGATRDGYAFQHEILRKTINDLIGEELLKNPVNLFPLINSVYKSTEGSVVEMAFHISTGTTKHERMRRKQSCLRSEKYHVGGKKAVNDKIEPYRLAVRWVIGASHKFKTRPEILFNGNSKHSLEANPVLNEIIISDCSGINDFSHIRGKLVEFLDADEKANAAA